MSFRSTVRPAYPRLIGPFDRWLSDPVTGAIVGVQNPNAGGQDTYFVPIPITAAQADQPTAAMIAMTGATFALSTAPYTRYFSDGTAIQPIAGAEFVQGTTLSGSMQLLIPPGAVDVLYSPVTVQSSAELVVEGELTVEAAPAPF